MGGKFRDRIPRPLQPASSSAPYAAPREGWYGDCRYHLHRYDPRMMRGRRVGWTRSKTRALSWLRELPKKVAIHEAWIEDARDNSKLYREGRFARAVEPVLKAGGKQ